MQSRYYNPSWGRFINADGITGVNGTLLSHNAYAYSMNNPINKQDENGHYATNVFGTEFTIKAVINTVVWSVMATKMLYEDIKQVFKSRNVRYSDNSEPTNEGDSGEDIFGVPSSDTPTTSQLRDHAKSKGWQRTKTPTGPEKWVDNNGIPRITLKKGTPRTPGSEMPHVEIKDSTGQRVDRFGNPVSKRSPGNHTPIRWDVND